MKKKGQAWGLDVIIASTLFIIGIITFYFYAVNYSNEAEIVYQDLLYHGEGIANSLLSEGYPKDWSNETVVELGIITANKIDNEKLAKFNNLSVANYEKTKAVLNTKYNFYINFSVPIEIEGNPVPYIGNYNDAADNLIKVTRFTIYNNQPVSLNIYIWS